MSATVISTVPNVSMSTGSPSTVRSSSPSRAEAAE